MRILHTADLHFGVPLARHSRIQDQFTQFERIVDIAIEQKCEIFLIAGDLFYERAQSVGMSQIIEGVAQRLIPLLKNDIIVIVLRGNHDPVEHFKMMDQVVALAAVAGGMENHRKLLYFVHEPSIITIKDKIQCICLPYPTTEYLIDLAEEEGVAAGDLLEHRNQIITRSYIKLYRTLVSELEPNIPAIVTGHFTVDGALLPGKQEEGFQFAWDSDFIFPKSEFSNSNIKYVALGHIHNLQRIPSMSCHAWYSGSPERLNYSEANGDKGILIVDVNQREPTKVSFIEVPATALLTVKCHSTDLDKKLDEIKHNKDDNKFIKFFITRSVNEQARTIRNKIRLVCQHHVGIEITDPEDISEIITNENSDENNSIAISDFRGTVLSYLENDIKNDLNSNKLRELLEQGMIETEKTMSKALKTEVVEV